MDNNNNTTEKKVVLTKDQLQKPNESKSAWFRRLNHSGMSVADISTGTGIRYQFVRNVIQNEKLKAQAAELESLKSEKTA